MNEDRRTKSRNAKPTSTAADPRGPKARKSQAHVAAGRRSADAAVTNARSLRPGRALESLRGHARWLLPTAWVTASIALGATRGPGTAILVLAGGALFAAIWVFWASVRTFFGEVPLSGADAYALGAPRAEEEQKRAVLRALKDIEFEHRVGKISDADYRELVARYRAEAKRLLRSLEAAEGPLRDAALARAAARLADAGLEDASSSYVPSRAGAHGETDDRSRAREAKPANETAHESGRPSTSRSLERVRRALQSSHSLEADAARPEAPLRLRKLIKQHNLGAWTCAACATEGGAEALFCKRCGQRRPDVAAMSPSDRPPHDGDLNGEHLAESVAPSSGSLAEAGDERSDLQRRLPAAEEA